MTKEIHNGLTFEQAYNQVVGSKFKVINQFKQFTTPEFDYEDMMSEADIAIMKAWREWDPVQAKFNTHATNMINWFMYKSLENYNPVFRTNRKTKMNLSNRGETFKSLAVIKKTQNEEFNKKHELDGEKPFTREHFNSYVYFISSQDFGVTVKNQCEFETSDDDVFDILNVVPDDSAANELSQIEVYLDLEHMDPTIQKVYRLIDAGYSLREALEEAGTTKHRLKSLYSKAMKANYYHGTGDSLKKQFLRNDEPVSNPLEEIEDVAASEELVKLETMSDLQKTHETIRKMWELMDEGYGFMESLEMAGTTKYKFKLLYTSQMALA